MKSSAETKNIAKALIQAQKAMTGAVKDSKNPFFNSSYADLESVIAAVKPALNAAGISFLQPCESEGETNVVKTLLMHESGEWIESSLAIPKVTDMQKLGASISYGRRYSLASICGLPQVDDDAESTMDRKERAIDQKTDLKQVKAVKTNAPQFGGNNGF